MVTARVALLLSPLGAYTSPALRRNLNRLQSPNSVHMCITAALIGCQDQFVRDSKDVHDTLIADETLYADGKHFFC